MRSFLALVMLLAFTGASPADAIRNGTTMQVKADSMWFQDVAQLTRWQALKTSGDAAALASYEKSVLGNRDAWQFINPLQVRILGAKPGKHQVDVKMLGEGRMKDSTWILDEDALVQ